MHDESVFVTLTYADDERTIDPCLNYPDFQRFMYRVRKRFGSVRFFACGEYGELNWRPHFHAILFGISFPDRELIGKMLYRSPVLDQLWPHGFASFGSCTYESAGYVAGYCLKKVTGPLASSHYAKPDFITGEIKQLTPEFGRMSLKPGIGYSWFQKYWRDVYLARDGVCLPGGMVVPPPRYYDKLLMDLPGDILGEKQFERYLKSEEFAKDCTPERLAVRELVTTSRLSMKERRL